MFLYPLSRKGLTRRYLAFGHSSSQALNKVAGLGVSLCTRDSCPLVGCDALHSLVFGSQTVAKVIKSWQEGDQDVSLASREPALCW